MITPEFLDELDRFKTSRKRNLASPYAGERETRQLGEGLTFRDYRRYTPGDDTRLVDWNVYARTGELYIKQFEAERNFTVHVLLDASRSMQFGEGDENKFDAAAKIGLGFAYLTAAENNDFRFSTFVGRPDRIDAGRSTAGEVLDVLRRCNAVAPAGEANFRQALEEYADGIRSRSLVVVASDFLGDVDEIDAGIEALTRNEVILAHVIAPDEREPPVRGDSIFQDLESDLSMRTYFGGQLERVYRDRLEAHVSQVADRGQSAGAHHAEIDTSEAFFDAFSRVWIG